MLPYWLFFILAAMPAIAAGANWRLRRDGTRSTVPDPLWFLVMGLLTLVIGWRWDVGGDWFNYFRYLNQSVGLTFEEILRKDDPAYWAANWLANEMGWGIQGVNAISGAIFSLGLVIFCRSLPRPWLALAVAMPYMVTVVAMGYTRQSVALGLAMIAFVALSRKRYILFGFWILAGATFHKSAVLLIPLAALTVTTNRYIVWPLIGVTGLIGWNVLLADAADGLVQNYIDSQMQSSGAFIRLAMNAVPAAMFLWFNKSFTMTQGEYKLWRLFSWISLGMFAAFFVTSFSTALDRMALYLIPLQLVVFSHLPDALGKFRGQNQALVAGVVGYYALVLFVWLNFATHSRRWLPYQIDLF